MLDNCNVLELSSSSVQQQFEVLTTSLADIQRILLGCTLGLVRYHNRYRLGVV